MIKNSQISPLTTALCVGKRAEWASWTVARLLNVITLGALVDFRVKLLLCSRVTVRAGILIFAVLRVAPFVALLHTGTGRRTVLELFRRSTTVLVIVILWTGIPATNQCIREGGLQIVTDMCIVNHNPNGQSLIHSNEV